MLMFSANNNLERTISNMNNNSNNLSVSNDMLNLNNHQSGGNNNNIFNYEIYHHSEQNIIE
jgi:hypothetical protein